MAVVTTTCRRPKMRSHRTIRPAKAASTSSASACVCQPCWFRRSLRLAPCIVHPRRRRSITRRSWRRSKNDLRCRRSPPGMRPRRTWAARWTLGTPRTDDPLAGVKPPTSKSVPKLPAGPDHIETILAEAAERLPIPEGDEPRAPAHITALYLGKGCRGLCAESLSSLREIAKVAISGRRGKQ